MTILSKAILNPILGTDNTKQMNQTEAKINQAKAAPSWVIGFLIIAEIGIIAFFALIYSGKASPLIEFDETTIPTFAVIIVATLTIITLYLSSQKIKRISKQIIEDFRNHGFNFLANKGILFSRFEGTYKGLRCQLSFGMGNDDTPDYYVLNLFHEKSLNMRLVCTNILSNQAGRLPKLPFYKPLGVVPINIPSVSEIKCWAGDKLLGQSLLDENQLRESLRLLAESANKVSGRFIIDDSGITLALAADVIPEQTLLDSAYNLCLGLGRSNLVPSRPIAPVFKVKALRTLILAGVCVFMAIFIMTILSGN
jgi:hypothetical protein